MAKRSKAKQTRRPRKAAREDDEPRGRKLWKGSISFGLVEIPVAVVPAEEPKALALTMLDRRDFSPIGYRRYNKRTGDEVDWSHVVRGYEYAKDEYVVLGEKELRRANPGLTQTIQILQFVEQAEIEPILYERPYYLEPSRKSKGYVLLRETLRQTGKVGIAKVVLRSRENLGAVAVRGDALVLYLLRFADEVRPPEVLAHVDLQLKDVDVRPAELQMAKRLVDDMTERWKPAQFSDEYLADVMKVVERKVASGDTHAIVDDDGEEDRPSDGGRLLDLMPLLEKSLRGGAARAGARRRTGAARSAAKATRAPARRRTSA